MASKEPKNPSSGGNPNNNPPTGKHKDFNAPSPLSIAGIRTKTQSLAVKIVMGIMIFIFAVAFIIPALNGGGVAPDGPNGGGANNAATVAQVGGETITGEQLNNAVEQQMQFAQYTGQTPDATNFLSTKQSALTQLTDNAATLDAAKKAGVTVSGEEIDKEIDKQIDEALKAPPGQSEAAFRRQIEQRYGSLEDAKAEVRKNVQRDGIEDKLLVDKLQKQVEEANKVTEDDFKRANTKLKLWQIVIRPKFPKSGTKDFKAEQEKNSAEAAKRAEKVFAQLKANPTLQNFKTTAQKSSDDEATKKTGGDFGWKLPAEVYYAPGMGDALAKSGGNLVGPLKDEGGNQYLFFIENRKTELPKDFAKNKKKLLEDFEKQKDGEAWTKAQTEYKKAVMPEIYDPALNALKIQTEQLFAAQGDEQAKLRQQVISDYEKALGSAGGMEAAAINFQLANLYREAGQKDKQIAALQAAVTASGGSNEAKPQTGDNSAPVQVEMGGGDANVRLELARALRDAGKNKDAVAQLKAASAKLDDAPPANPMFGGYDPSTALRQQIAAEFDLNKEAKLAAAERAKIKPANPSPMGGGMDGLPPGIQIMPQGQ